MPAVDVTELVVPARPTAVVATATDWDAYPQLWPALLAEVWQAVRADATVTPGRNVMLYRDDVPNVEVGVEVEGMFAGAGRVIASELPAGRVVTARAESLDALDDAHRAVADACRERGLERFGPRWEIYGHQRGNAPVTVDVYYLVR